MTYHGAYKLNIPNQRSHFGKEKICISCGQTLEDKRHRSPADKLRETEDTDLLRTILERHETQFSCGQS